MIASANIAGCCAKHTATSAKGRQLHALAVTTSTRFEGMPDIATVGDTVPNCVASQWCGIGAPKNTC
jgi:tripartite-type tricarboxylate transporter receptor subunit TctC